ncbi:MAG: Yip1 family protein [Methanoregula sp.]
MTNMEGVGLPFLLMCIGMPLVLLAIVTGYLVHRRRSRRPGETDGAPAPEEMHPGKESIKKILMHPDLFFWQVTESRPDLFYPFLLIACAGLVVCTGYLSLIFPTILYGDIPNLLFLVFGTYPLFVFSAWFGWLAVSVLFFAVSAVFKGSGPFTATLKNTGYGTAFCLFLTGLIFLLGSAANAVSLAITGGVNFGLYMAGQPQLPLAAVCGIGFCAPLAWGVLLWGHGLAHARKIPLSRAMVPAAAAAAICLILMYGLFISPLVAALS